MADRIIFITYIFGFILLFVITTFIYFLRKEHRNWKSKIKNSRPVERMFQTKQNFIDHFVKKGYSVESIEFVYRQTQKFLKAKDIVLLPQDNLIELYERQQDEWFYIINKWFTEMDKPKLDEKKFNNLLEKHKVVNFEFLIELFDK